MTDMSEIGAKIRSARKAKGFSQEVLGQKTGVARYRVSQMENGCYQGRISDFLKVLSALHLDLVVEDWIPF
jgi:transcriptional regulator with XRE-family HTH domain